jgi:hypothetical protein
MKRRLALARFWAIAVPRRALTACVILCTVEFAFPQSDPKATIITFEAPGAGAGQFQGTSGNSINPEGVIAGIYTDSSGIIHGLLRTPSGAFIESDQAACSQGVPAANINPAGEVTGFCAGAASVYHALLRAPDGAITTFDAPGAGTCAGQGTFTAYPTGLNQAGASTGDFLDANNVFHGWLRTAEGAITTFDAPGAGTGAGQGTLVSFFHSAGSGGMNDQGDITGTYVDANNLVHGFLRDNGSFTTFDAPGAGTVIGSLQGTYPQSINPAGTITGAYYDNNNAAHGFLRTRDGTISTFDVAGGGTGAFQGTFGLGINPAGTSTGTYLDANNVYHGFLRAPDGTITTFNPPGMGAGVGQGALSVGINPAGAVTGYFLDSNNVWHGFVRMPCGQDGAKACK